MHVIVRIYLYAIEGAALRRREEEALADERADNSKQFIGVACNGYLASACIACPFLFRVVVPMVVHRVAYPTAVMQMKKRDRRDDSRYEAYFYKRDSFSPYP